MSRPIIRRLGASLAALVSVAGLSGCVTDPEFLDNLALFTDALAYELAEDCYNQGYGYAYPPAHCAYGGYDPYAQPVYVEPVYVAPPRQAEHRGDRHRRDRHDDRGRRGGGRRGGK